MRPSWDEYFMSIVATVATRGTCDRRRVGAIAVRGFQILATGYNGAPPGVAHCDEAGHDLTMDGTRESCARAVHAEINVVAQAAKHGIALEDATIYCNTYPCHRCFKTIVSAGVKRFVYDSDYFNDPKVYEIAKAAGVDVVRFRK